MLVFIVHGLSLVVVCGLLIAVASLVADHGLQSAWASVVVVSVDALGHVESSQARDRTHVPCIGRQILNPWTTREVLPGYQPFLNEERCPGYFNGRVP